MYRFPRTGRLMAAAVVSIALSVGASGHLLGPPVAHAVTAPTRPTFDAPPISSLSAGGGEKAGMNAMAAGDFNADGSADFASVPYGGAAPGATPQTGVSVYLGNGNGTFRAPVEYAAGLYPIDVVAARLRGPNAPIDLITLDAGSSSPGQYTIAVLLGNGDGTFQAPLLTTIPYSGVSLVAGDFNGDGNPDVAVGGFSGLSSGPQELTILVGKGNGSFQAPKSYTAGDGTSGYYAMAVGDFNNDGHLDVLGMDPTGLWLSLGNGDGTFNPAALVWADPTTYLGPQLLGGPQAIAVGDFNGDGNLDVALDIDGARVDVLLGMGTGTFVPLSTPAYVITKNQTGYGGGSIAAADLNGDGNIDLVVTTGWGTTLAILNGKGNGTFARAVVYPLPQYDDQAMVVADANRDGKPDVVVGTDLGTLAHDVNYLTVLLNAGNGRFLRPQQFPVVAPYNSQSVTTTNPIGIALGDLNGDGKQDAVVTEWDLPIEPAANGELPSLPTVSTTNDTVDTGGSIAVLLGNGNSTFQTEKQYYVGGRPIAAAIGDLTGDNKPDIVVANAFSGTLSLLKGNGDGTFQPAITIPVGQNPTSLTLTDFNHDGRPDIAVTDLLDGTISVLINRSAPGQIAFAPAVSYNVGIWPDGIVAGDFNNDGNIDLAVLNDGNPYPPYSSSSSTTLSVLLGNGNGTFQAAHTRTLWSKRAGGDALAVGTFGSPGHLDLAAANFDLGKVMVLRGSTDGTFTPVGGYTVGAGPESLAVADFNGDGLPDLAVDDLNDGSVAMLMGRGSDAFRPAATSTTKVPVPFGWAANGYPGFLAAGRLTRTGLPDIVTGNLFEAAITVLRNRTP